MTSASMEVGWHEKVVSLLPPQSAFPWLTGIFIFPEGSLSNVYLQDLKNYSHIFSENYLWYKYAKKSSEKYGAPVNIILSFLDHSHAF